LVRALGIETATSIASVGIVVGDQIAAERTVPMRGSHARTLLPLIDATLQAAGLPLSEIELLAVSIGPGSFTGLRIGLSVVKGLALATGIPVVGVPTLEAYARAAGPRLGLVCPVLDARKGEVYGASFRWRDGEPQCLTAPTAMSPARFATAVHEEPCTLIGDGVDAYHELPPSGAVVARLGCRRAAAAIDDVAALEPQYCRASEAEIGQQRRGASA
jgi:tRNA threonylcarbamoyladenosine biosynthesis protein TsaB